MRDLQEQFSLEKDRENMGVTSRGQFNPYCPHKVVNMTMCSKHHPGRVVSGLHSHGHGAGPGGRRSLSPGRDLGSSQQGIGGGGYSHPRSASVRNNSTRNRRTGTTTRPPNPNSGDNFLHPNRGSTSTSPVASGQKKNIDTIILKSY